MTLAPAQFLIAPTVKSSRLKPANNFLGLNASIIRRGGEIAAMLRSNKPAVLIACSGDPFDLAASSIASRRLDIPLVAYLFDDPIFQWPDGMYRKLARIWEQVWARRADLVIVPNEVMRADFLRRWPGAKVAIVRNPARFPSASEVSPTARALGSAMPGGVGPLRIVYTGSVYQAQGDAFRNLVASLDRLRGAFELHVYSAQGQASFDAEGVVGPHVFRHAHVPDTEVSRVQQEADILFLPLSFTEIPEVIRSSAPGKTAEYLASGRPALVHAPAGSWVAQFAKERGCAAVVDTSDVEMLTATLMRLRHDDGYCATLVANALRVAPEFSCETAREAFWSLVREVGRRSSQRRATAQLPSVGFSPRPPRTGRNTPPRILFVAMQNSPHTARWIEMIAGRGWDLHLFPLDEGSINPNLCGITVHRPRLSPPRPEDELVLPVPPAAIGRVSPARVVPFRASLKDVGGVKGLESKALSWGMPDLSAPPFYGPRVLASLIDQLKPDIVHSMEFQHAGYLALGAKEILGDAFPVWLATNWGSDIFYFRRFPEHREKIVQLLNEIDFYSCECHRDIAQAQEMGYRGPILTVLPNTGGFDMDHIARLRSPDPPSKRKRLMVKGYEHFAGRAMVSLLVLESIADRLKDYEIILYSVSSGPLARAHELVSRGILNIKVVGWATHDEMLTYFGTSRLYLGVSISDGISTSVLEAMAMGTFPIQTNTSCCDEWFLDGTGGFIVSPDNPHQIRNRILAALDDDALVDQAAKINAETVARRLDRRVLAPRVANFYEPLLEAVGLEGSSDRAEA